MSRKTLSTRVLSPVVATLLLAGCGGDTGPVAAATRGSDMPPADALPDCTAIGAATNGFVDGWALSKDSGAFENAPDNYGVSCSWISPRGLSGNPREMIQAAGFTVAINVQGWTQTEAEARSIGWVVDDAEVKRAGGYLTFPAGRLDYDKQLRVIGPTVTIGKTSVALVQTGAFVVNEIDEGKPMTNRRAVDIALAVHRLIER